MIYELVVAYAADSTDEQVTKSVNNVKDAIKSFEGEVLLEDDWGRIRFAQLTSDGKETGRFTYIIFKSENSPNEEINRRLKITENVLKYMCVKFSEKETVETVLKNYRTPYSKTKKGSVVDDFEEKGSDLHKDRKKFSKRKTCWFTAKEIKADWKDPNTYSWLVNEFGKISAKRVSGISKKHQRWATTAIKRARNMGIISHTSGRTAQASH